MKKAVSGIVLMLLLTSMLSSAFIIQPVKAKPKTRIKDDDSSPQVNSLTTNLSGVKSHPLIDATHATHPFNYGEYYGEGYKDKYPEATVLTLNFTRKFIDKTFTSVENLLEISFEIEADLPVLGFRTEYYGPWGGMGSRVRFPNGSEVEVFNDTIYNEKIWYFHFHNPPLGSWSLKITVTEEPVNIAVTIGECAEPISKNVLNNYDFLILCSPYQAYSREERSIILEFLTEGGSLLIAGESGGSVWGQNLNEVMKPLGITFNGLLIDPTNNRGENLEFQPILYNFTEHPIALRAKKLGVDNLTIFAGGALEITNPDVQIVLRGDEDTSARPTYDEGTFPPFVATLLYQNGRIFVQGDSTPAGGEGWYQAIAEWLMNAIPVELIVPDDYPTIQEAINAASPGDTIFVRAGTYYENVVVNKTVSLVGENRENTIIDGSGTGTVVSVTVNDVEIQGFTIQNSGSVYPDSGITIQGCVNIIIQDNSITNNYYGLRISRSSGNTVSGNNITYNFYGVWLGYSSDNIIINNNVTKHNNGVYLSHHTSNNTVSENNIKDNKLGIYLISSSGNTFSQNNIESNECGINAQVNSSKNIIYHNNFIENTRQVYSYDSTNFWDDGYPSGGNYWSDYTGVDTNSDGIGDTPYVIDADNRDRYPLMKPVGSYFDLAIDNVEISDLSPEEGQPISIHVRIKNTGNAASKKGKVELQHIINYAKPIKKLNVFSVSCKELPSIPPGSSATVEFVWNATEIVNDETEPLRVIISSKGDTDFSNNIYYVTGLEVLDTSEFDMDTDAYSFSNREATEYGKSITKSELKKYVQLMLQLHFPFLPETIREAVSNYIISAYADFVIRGYCYGISTTSSKYYADLLQKPVDKSTFQMLIEEAFSNIESHQFEALWATIEFNLKQSINLKDEFNAIVDSLNNGIPPLLLMRIKSGSTKEYHAVLVYNAYSVSDNIKHLIIYDNNYPGTALVYVLDLENNRIYSPTYDIVKASAGSPLLPSERIKKAVEDLLKDIMKTLKGTLIFQSPVNVTITDQYGRIISEETNEIPGATFEYYNTTQAKIFQIPLNMTYTIQVSAYKEGNCTITNIMPFSEESASCSVAVFNLTVNTKALFNLEAGNPDYTLHIDEDGDGVVDYKAQPKKASFQMWKTLYHEVVVDGQTFIVTTESNSTISNFNFNKKDKKTTFTVDGLEDSIGYCNITIPLDLLGGPYTVEVDNATVLENYDAPTNGTHAFIYLTYNHSTHIIEIIGTTVIPEFPSTILLTLIALSTLSATMLKKRFLKRTKRKH